MLTLKLRATNYCSFLHYSLAQGNEIKRLEAEVMPFGFVPHAEGDLNGVWDGEDRWFP